MKGVGDCVIRKFDFDFFNVLWRCIDIIYDILVVVFEEDVDDREGLDSDVELFWC